MSVRRFPWRPLDVFTLYLGSMDAGKSVRMINDMEEAAADECPIRVLDTQGQWTSKRNLTVIRGVVGFEGFENQARAALREAPCTIVVDEIHRWFGGKKEFGFTATQEILHCGRQAIVNPGYPFNHRGPVCIVAGTQRPFDLPPAFRSGLSLLYLGKTGSGDVSTLDWIEDATGDRSLRNILPGIEQGRFIVRRLKG